MNHMQEKLFQLLKEFTQICEMIRLPYFLVCGSALGAVKYGGFIPWDDDVDVAMFRDDYEVFCQKAPAILPRHYFLQNYHTEPAFPAIYSKLRDSTTTCIEQSVASLPINHGVCIDIFPLDGYPSDNIQQRQLERKKKIYTRLLSVPCVRSERWKEMVVQPLRILGVGKQSEIIADKYTKCISAWPVQSSVIVANHGNWQGNRDYHEKEDFGQGIQATFEGLAVRIPYKYEKYLIQKYGNYHNDPPAEKQKSHHIYLRADPDHPYTDYI